MALALYAWQQRLADELLAMKENMPNGVLVYGPRGIGTFDVVLRFAQSLLCTAPLADGSACGRCKGCRLAQAHTHPDIRYVLSEAEALPRDLPYTPPDNSSSDRKNLYREILIHQPRALTDFLNLTSHEGGRRVVLVYPADQIRAEAAASFLKSLEEPPPNTVFVLVADELDRVLPTIRSRCRLVRAQAPTHAQSIDFLRGRGEKNPEQALMLAGGRPLAVYESDQRLVLGDAARDKLLTILRAGGAARVDQVIAAVGRDASVPATGVFLSRWAWDLACVRQGAQARYFPDEQDALAQLAGQCSAAALYLWINSVRDVNRVANHPLSARGVVEQLLLAYARVFTG